MFKTIYNKSKRGDDTQRKMKIFLTSIFFLGISFSGVAQSNDEEAIKSVCEKETQSWNNRDAEGMISCHANKPYSLMLVAENGNVHYATANSSVDSEKTIREMVKMMGKPGGETFKNIGYVIRINGTSAFVYYDQVVSSTDGKEEYFHEVRNLENWDGKWKIIYVGAVKFKPDGK
jgi:hypothetical protein